MSSFLKAKPLYLQRRAPLTNLKTKMKSYLAQNSLIPNVNPNERDHWLFALSDFSQLQQQPLTGFLNKCDTGARGRPQNVPPWDVFGKQVGCKQEKEREKKAVCARCLTNLTVCMVRSTYCMQFMLAKLIKLRKETFKKEIPFSFSSSLYCVSCITAYFSG